MTKIQSGQFAASGDFLQNITTAIAIQQQAKSQERAGKIQQVLFEREAANVFAASQREAKRRKKLGEKIAGRQRAIAGASGIQLEGSALDVLGLTLQEAEQAALEELFRGSEQAFGLRARGAFARFTGRQAKRQANIAEAGLILSNIALAAQASGAGGGGGGGGGGG